MAKIEKCDNCGALERAGIEIDTVSQHLSIDGDKGLSIYIDVPSKWRNRDLCGDCQAEIIRARFAELCGMLAPYQPERVSGFIQNSPTQAPTIIEPALSDQERKALAVLSRRLLKA